MHSTTTVEGDVRAHCFSDCEQAALEGRADEEEDTSPAWWLRLQEGVSVVLFALHEHWVFHGLWLESLVLIAQCEIFTVKTVVFGAQILRIIAEFLLEDPDLSDDL